MNLRVQLTFFTSLHFTSLHCPGLTIRFTERPLKIYLPYLYYHFFVLDDLTMH